MTVRDRIKEIRKTEKLTQDEFAKKIGVSRNYVCLCEKGERNYSDRTLKDICRTFGISELWVKNGDGNMHSAGKEEDEIKTFLHKIIADDDSSFKKRFISVMAKMTESEWDIIEKRIREITEEDKLKTEKSVEGGELKELAH